MRRAQEYRKYVLDDVLCGRYGMLKWICTRIHGERNGEWYCGSNNDGTIIHYADELVCRIACELANGGCLAQVDLVAVTNKVLSECIRNCRMERQRCNQTNLSGAARIGQSA